MKARIYIAGAIGIIALLGFLFHFLQGRTGCAFAWLIAGAYFGHFIAPEGHEARAYIEALHKPNKDE